MFEKYHFQDYILKAIEKLGFVTPTEIQDAVIPRVERGENVIGKSQTGTGKTHAFLLPLLDRLQLTGEVEAVIIVPTRELALQIYQETGKITELSPQPIDVRMYVGGTDRDAEMKRLEKSQPTVVIGTIGKIKDLAISENLLKIHTARTVVIDEADMVFEMSEIPEIDSVFARFENDVQTLVFSATLPVNLMMFLNKYLKKFEIVDLTKKEISKKEIEHIFIPTKNKNKDDLLVTLLNTFHPYLALVFANTKTKVDEIADMLSSRGFKIGKLTGDLEARERKQMLKRIKDGLYQYVVASDIASRGIDIIGVSHVINYELPEDIGFYIHRTGRSGRAENTGVAISFYDYEDDNYLNQLEAKGLKCVYKALKDGELLPTKERNAHLKKVTKTTEAIEKIHQRIPVPKRVKPGYKKKRKETIDKEVKKLKRAKIEKFYRKKAREEGRFEK